MSIFIQSGERLCPMVFSCHNMPVDEREDEEPSSLYSPASAALTPGGTEEDGGANRGSAVCSIPGNSQGSETAAAYPANPGPGEGTSGKVDHV